MCETVRRGQGVLIHSFIFVCKTVVAQSIRPAPCCTAPACADAFGFIGAGASNFLLPTCPQVSEAEALRLRDSDLLILAARNEDDVSYLEVRLASCSNCSKDLTGFRRGLGGSSVLLALPYTQVVIQANPPTHTSIHECLTPINNIK